jgi:hypothetical protein
MMGGGDGLCSALFRLMIDASSTSIHLESQSKAI